MQIFSIINETILETRQEFFFTKVALAQSTTDIVLLDCWLILLFWLFISSYITIYFFVNKFICSNVYISLNAKFECLYMLFGWESDHQLGTYPTSWRMGEVHPKSARLRKKGLFCAEVKSFFSKSIFTHFASCWSRSHVIGLWRNFKAVYSSFHWLNDSGTQKLNP